MFELANYLVGIYKVNDCTDSCTLLNHPPQLPTSTSTQQSRMPAFSQLAGGTIAQDTIMMAENEENHLPESQPQPTQMSQDVCGRETTFAPPIDSTGINETQPPPRPSQELLLQGRDTTFAPPMESTAIAPSAAPRNLTPDRSLQSPRPSTPPTINT